MAADGAAPAEDEFVRPGDSELGEFLWVSRPSSFCGYPRRSKVQQQIDMLVEAEAFAWCDVVVLTDTDPSARSYPSQLRPRGFQMVLSTRTASSNCANRPRGACARSAAPSTRRPCANAKSANGARAAERLATPSARRKTPGKLWDMAKQGHDHSNSMITSSTARLSPGPAFTLATTPFFSARRMLHLHRLDRAQRLAFLHFLAHFDIDLHDQAGHRTEQHFRRIRQQLFGIGQPSSA